MHRNYITSLPITRKVSCLYQNWEILKRGSTKDLSQILTICTDTLSHPWALLTSKAQIIQRSFAGSRFSDSKRWWASRYSAGNSLPVSIKQHCFKKKSWRHLLLPRYQLKTCYCDVWEEFWVFCAYAEIYVRLTSIFWE